METSFRGDFRLLILVGILVMVSIIMITSIGVPKSIELSAPNVLYPSCDDVAVDCYLLLKKHLIRMAVGLLGFFIASNISYKFWRGIAVPFFGVIFLLLLAVLFLGSTHNTFARSWLQFFDTSFQPTEMAKLAMTFYLAYWCEKKQKEIDTLHGGFIPFVTVVFFILLPVLLQPDVGSAFLMIGI
ncbi:MAG: FtsW/RodA/SpoVE family cell cycle protein, partial [Patescibacteria group bacterium]